MTFYSKVKKDEDDDMVWSSYIETIFYLTDSNRLYSLSTLDGKCRLCYNDFLQFHKVPEISKELVLEYIKFQITSLESDYFKEMAKANNLDDTDTIRRLKKFYKRISNDG